MLSKGGKDITVGEQNRVPKFSDNQKFILENMQHILKITVLQTGNKSR